MKVSDKVQALLDSDFTAYDIAKQTGVAQPIVTRLRNGERQIKNLSLINAEKLAGYWDAKSSDSISNTNNTENIDAFKTHLSAQFKQLIANQRAKATDESSGEATAKVLEQLLVDVINDDHEIHRLMSTYNQQKISKTTFVKDEKP